MSFLNEFQKFLNNNWWCIPISNANLSSTDSISKNFCE